MHVLPKGFVRIRHFGFMANSRTRSRGNPSRRDGIEALTFEADDVEIGIWLRPSQDQSLTLLGQILDKSSGPIQDPSAYVDLVAEGDHIKTSPLNPWGEFVFTELPKNPYGLQFHFHDRVVQIPSLSVTHEEGSQL